MTVTVPGQNNLTLHFRFGKRSAARNAWVCATNTAHQDSTPVFVSMLSLDKGAFWVRSPVQIGDIVVLLEAMQLDATERAQNTVNLTQHRQGRENEAGAGHDLWGEAPHSLQPWRDQVLFALLALALLEKGNFHVILSRLYLQTEKTLDATEYCSEIEAESKEILVLRPDDLHFLRTERDARYLRHLCDVEVARGLDGEFGQMHIEGVKIAPRQEDLIESNSFMNLPDFEIQPVPPKARAVTVAYVSKALENRDEPL